MRTRTAGLLLTASSSTVPGENILYRWTSVGEGGTFSGEKEQRGTGVDRRRSSPPLAVLLVRTRTAGLVLTASSTVPGENTYRWTCVDEGMFPGWRELHGTIVLTRSPTVPGENIIYPLYKC